jgi:hypothetical protein
MKPSKRARTPESRRGEGSARRIATRSALTAATFALQLTSRSAQAQMAPQARVYVHIDSPSRVELQTKTDFMREPFFSVCASPCDTYVSAGDSYRVDGYGIRASPVFAVPAEPARISIAVHPAWQAWFATGVALVVAGGISMLLGAVTIQGSNGAGHLNPLSVTSLIGGTAAVAGGITILALTGPTRVMLSDAR